MERGRNHDYQVREETERTFPGRELRVDDYVDVDDYEPMTPNTRSKTIPLHLRFLVRVSLVLGVLLVFLHVLGYPSYSNSQEADGTNCPSGVTGLCTWASLSHQLKL